MSDVETCRVSLWQQLGLNQLIVVLDGLISLIFVISLNP